MIRKTFITRGLIFIRWFCKGHTKGKQNPSADAAKLFPLHQWLHKPSLMRNKWGEKRKDKAPHAFTCLYISCKRRRIFAFQYHGGAIWLWQQYQLCGGGRDVNMICWGYLPHQVNQAPSAANTHRQTSDITEYCIVYHNLIHLYDVEQKNEADVVQKRVRISLWTMSMMLCSGKPNSLRSVDNGYSFDAGQLTLKTYLTNDRCIHWTE